MTTLTVNGSPVTITSLITDLGKLDVGTKILFVLDMPESNHLAFVQEPGSNKITPKSKREGVYTKNWSVVKLDNGCLAVQGWPSNGFYLAIPQGEGKVSLTFYSVVTRRAKFYFVEETQVVVFHTLMDKPFTAQLRGLRTVADYIVQLVLGDELSKMAYDVEPQLPVGTVLWYSISRNIGAVVTGYKNDDYECSRVHVSQIMGMDDTLPHLTRGQIVSWEDTKEISSPDTKFRTELLGVSVK